MAQLGIAQFATAGVTSDLPTAGTDDWFNYPGTTTINRKSGVDKIAVALIAGTTGLAVSGTYNTTSPSTLTWSGGAPVASGSSDNAIRSAVVQQDKGWSITAPAGTGVRTLKLYCGAYLATMKVAASLSDGSAVAVQDLWVAGSGVGDVKGFAITYAAGSEGQTLTVNLTNNTGAANSEIGLQGGALSLASGGGGGGDTVKPTITAAAVANSTPTVVSLTASESLDGANVPAASAFTVAGHTVQSVAISGAAINLTVTPAFVNGEAARTVAYTQPGTNNARDVAGNLLDNFTGLAVTNNVQAAGDTTPPAFASAQVTNSQPSIVQVTMNETLAASVPPAGAFAVSGGRTVSSVSISGAVVSLTVNTPYANGDVITVAYTQPGTNPRLQDAAGNLAATFAAQSVTNNIAAPVSGSLTTDALTTSGTLRPSGTAVYYTLLRGGQIGVGTGTVTHGSSTLTAASKLSLSGLTAGSYMVWMRFDDGGVAYQEITVA